MRCPLTIIPRLCAGDWPLSPTRAYDTDSPAIDGPPSRPQAASPPLAAMRREVLRLEVSYRDPVKISDAEVEGVLDAISAIKRQVAASVRVCDTAEAICALEWVTAETQEEMPDGAFIEALISSVVAMLRRNAA